MIDRRRIELVDPDSPQQAYHAAAELDLAEAEALIDRWARGALRHAAYGMAAARRVAAHAGCDLVAVSIAAEVRDLPPLARALCSHPLLHACEGQLSREAIAEAAQQGGLPVHHYSPRGPFDATLTDQATKLGRSAGPPWRKEHKAAALVALTTLAELSP